MLSPNINPNITKVTTKLMLNGDNNMKTAHINTNPKVNSKLMLEENNMITNYTNTSPEITTLLNFDKTNVYKSIGIKETTIIETIIPLCKRNMIIAKVQGKSYENLRKNLGWVKLTYEELLEKMNHIMSRRTLATKLKELTELGVLLKSHRSKNRYKRTCWYSIDQSKLDQYLNKEIGVIKAARVVKRKKDKLDITSEVRKAMEMNKKDPHSWRPDLETYQYCKAKYYLSNIDVETALNNFIIFHTNRKTEHLITDQMFKGWCRNHKPGSEKWIDIKLQKKREPMTEKKDSKLALYNKIYDQDLPDAVKTIQMVVARVIEIEEFTKWNVNALTGCQIEDGVLTIYEDPKLSQGYRPSSTNELNKYQNDVVSELKSYRGFENVNSVKFKGRILV